MSYVNLVNSVAKYSETIDKYIKLKRKMEKKHTDKDVVELFDEFAILIATPSRPDLNDLKRLFMESKGLLKEEFEVGDYIFFVEEGKVGRLYHDCKNDNSFIFDGTFKKTNNVRHIGKGTFFFRKATDKEVGEALIKEAKKKGFKNVKVVWGGGEIRLYDNTGNNSNHIINPIYYKGEWAEIVEEKEIDYTSIFANCKSYEEPKEDEFKAARDTFNVDYDKIEKEEISEERLLGTIRELGISPKEALKRLL